MSKPQPPQPLTAAEEDAWRALIRLMVQLPKAIDEDLIDRNGLPLTRYVVLMRLSEAPQNSLRMSDLAAAAAISPSRMTRVIQAMEAEGLVIRREHPGDSRATLAVLTRKGIRRLENAWPAHLAGVRELVLDHIDPADLSDFTQVVYALLAGVEASRGIERA